MLEGVRRDLHAPVRVEAKTGNHLLLPVAISLILTAAGLFFWIAPQQGINTISNYLPTQVEMGLRYGLTIWGAISFITAASHWAISGISKSIATFADEPTSRYQTENRLARLAKDIISPLICPWGIYNLIHYFIGMAVNPASSPLLNKYVYRAPNPGNLEFRRRQVNPNENEWLERISVGVNDWRLDGYVGGKDKNCKRWVLISLGAGLYYEEYLHKIFQISEHYEANVLFFNYPGVGESTGFATRKGLRDSYRAMLREVESHLGAEEIIGYGISLGSLAQGEGLRDYPLDPDKKYIFIKDRAPRSVAVAIPGTLDALTGGEEKCFLKPIKALMQAGLCFFNWNARSIPEEESLFLQEIILQSAGDTSDATVYSEFKGEYQIAHDGLFDKEASYAFAVASKGANLLKKRKIYLTGGHHFSGRTVFVENRAFAESVTALFASDSERLSEAS
jgi:hypothetical protein